MKTVVGFGIVPIAKDLKDRKDEKDSTENFVNAEARHYNAFVLLDIISNLQHSTRKERKYSLWPFQKNLKT
ncbi:MAG: hypothetical protein GXY07_04780 [Candidatus Hydrogenedentes bacterium]|nr:hypothetical protein [Candidatus Hydrogenedentota bacterium]